MSITCVEAGDLLPETAPCSSQIGALSGPVKRNVYQNGVILVESSQARRDLLTSIIEAEWHIKVIALASVEEWLKLCDYVPAGLVLLSQFDSRADSDRKDDIARIQGRNSSTAILKISNRYAGISPLANETLQLKSIFEESTLD
ncbi:MAG: hypothetical protein ACFCUR_15475 [Rhodomicrobiaceae bacterium]